MSITINPRTLQRCPADIDEAIAFLRAEGLSIIETMWVLSNRCGLSLGEAKKRVSASPVWADVVEQTNRAIDRHLDEVDEP